MPFILPNGYAQISLGWFVPGQAGEVLNVFGVNPDITFENFQIAAAVALAAEELGPAVSTVVEITSIKVASAVPDEDPLVVTYPASIAGERSGDILPVNNATLATKFTNLGGRHGRGRMYLPCAVASDVTDAGTWESAASSAINTALGDFGAALADGDVPMVLFHADNSTPTPVTQISLASKIANQRDRLR